MKTYTFRIIIEPDEKNTFHGYAPSLPGCHTWGKSLKETKKNLREAIELYLEDLIKEKKSIPQEGSFEWELSYS
jgi:antitoxin HicB